MMPLAILLSGFLGKKSGFMRKKTLHNALKYGLFQSETGDFSFETAGTRRAARGWRSSSYGDPFPSGGRAPGGPACGVLWEPGAKNPRRPDRAECGPLLADFHFIAQARHTRIPPAGHPKHASSNRSPALGAEHRGPCLSRPLDGKSAWSS